MGPSSDSAALITMLRDLADLLEQSVADGTSIRALVGDDPSKFAETFLGNYPGGSWIRSERAAGGIHRPCDRWTGKVIATATWSRLRCDRQD